MPDHVDVVVVGARVGGAPLATLLARSGRSVALVDKATQLGNVLSSHVMQADTLRFVTRLGVLPEVLAAGSVPFTAADARIESFRALIDYPLRPGDIGGGISVRRHVFDPILLDAARRAGVTPLLGTRVVELLRDPDGRVRGVRVVRDGRTHDITATLVVGADGRQSTVARLVGARRYHVTRNTRAYHWAYYAGATPAGPPAFVFHRWADRFVLGCPTDSGLYMVGTSHSPGSDAGYDRDREGAFHADAMGAEPVATAIGGAERVGKVYGITRFDGYFREAAGPGWALIGDAGHFKDPAAGRGIGDAFRQVEHLHDALLPVLDAGPSDVDAVTGGFARWRDREFIEHYWLGVDLGAAGPVPSVLAAMVQRVVDQGQGGRVLEILNHDALPSQLLTPGRAVGATARLLATGGAPRRQVLAEFRAALADQARRAKLTKRPEYEAAAPTPRHDAAPIAGGVR